MTFQLLFQPGDRQFRSVDFFCGICRFPFKFPDIVMNSPQGLTARIEAEQQLFQFEFCVPVEALACLNIVAESVVPGFETGQPFLVC